VTPQNQVTIGKCSCGHSRAAHNTKLGGCGFCACMLFQLDDIIREDKTALPRRQLPAAPPPDAPKAS
jgi:hypothetical protein